MVQVMIGLNGSLIYKTFAEIIFVVPNSRPPPINYPSKFMWDVMSFREKKHIIFIEEEKFCIRKLMLKEIPNFIPD